METPVITLQLKDKMQKYLASSCHVKYEKEILNEIIQAIDSNDTDKINWFNQFGHTMRHITMNVHAYRVQQEFGFTGIAFNKHGWFECPDFLEREEIYFGIKARFLDYSTMTLGRGPNGIWTNALSIHFGCAGSSSPLCIYGKRFRSRDEALTDGLTELKSAMTATLNHSDTTNYKQSVILAILKDIAKMHIDSVQLSLF